MGELPQPELRDAYGRRVPQCRWAVVGRIFGSQHAVRKGVQDFRSCLRVITRCGALARASVQVGAKPKVRAAWLPDCLSLNCLNSPGTGCLNRSTSVLWRAMLA